MSDKLVKPGASELSAILGGLTDDDMMARPDFIAEGDKSGTEDIGQDDIRIPRLGIAQGLSPQVTPGDSQYIPGLQLFQMFNDTTKQIYGNGPVYFIAVRRDLRCIEFRPRSEGGGIVDLNVDPKSDKATKWREVDGKRIPPAATTFTEWVALLLKAEVEPEAVVISVKHTNKHNRRAVTDLNGYIKMHASQGKKSVPIYGVIYSISTKFEKNDNGTFGVPVFNQVGFIPRSKPELFERAKMYAQMLETKNVLVEREPGDEDDFPTDEAPREGVVEGQVVR